MRDAVACFECKVRGKLVTGDHTIFAGEILASYITDKYKERLELWQEHVSNNLLKEHVTDANGVELGFQEAVHITTRPIGG